MTSPTRLLLAAALLLAAIPVQAQDQTKKTKSEKKKEKSDTTPPKPGKVSEFWKGTAPLEITLTVNLKKIRGDRDKAQAPWESATFSYVDSGKTVTVPARVKSRGISRLKICSLFPPVWVDFASSDTKKLLLDHLNRFKLVTPCKPPNPFEKYTIEEYNLYRVYGLLTPIGHLARLMHMTVVDSASGKPDFNRYVFALEDPDEMASRLGGKIFKAQGAVASDMNTRQTALVGMIEYLLGNTDFSIYALHNVELVQLNGDVFPVVYDFDQAGVIAPPYAIPDQKLGIRSVKDRVYRGLCVSPDTVKSVITEMLSKQSAILGLYEDDVGKLIGNPGVPESKRWFNDVFDELKDQRFVKNEILGKCRDVR
jgi:hypothetical protein